MVLDPNQHQGLFGESFVRVLASAAGLIVSRADLDVDGCDFTLSHKGSFGGTRHPKIDVQVKSWSRPVRAAGHWKYRIRVKYFNELAGEDFALPRFLVLVIVPDDCADYATTRHDAAELKHAAYWLSLRDRQPVPGAPETKVRVDVPVANLLTVETLRTLMAPSASARAGGVMLTGMTAEAIAGIDPAGIVAYLNASGWRETGNYGRAAIWTRLVDGAEVEVLVPVSAQLRDYPARLAELINTLALVEGRPAPEVAQDLRSSRLDVQYIRMLPDGPSGSTPLHEGYLAVKGVHDLFLAAATSAVSAARPTVLPSQKPPRARGFVDQVRLGQTSRGSYVLRVETPLEFVEQPVSSREVLLHLYQAASAAQDAAARSSRDGDPTPFVERVGEGVSANLCDALVDIGGQRQSSFEIRFAWAPASPVRLDTPVVRFDRPVIAALKTGAKFLRKLPVTETATVTGRVVDLHRTPMDRLGRVQVEGVVQASNQRHEGRVTMRLAPRDYDLAVSAHSAGRPLRVLGELRHTGRQFEISTVSSVEIVPPPPG